MVSDWERASEERSDNKVKGMESGGPYENFGFCTEAQHDQICIWKITLAAGPACGKMQGNPS